LKRSPGNGPKSMTLISCPNPAYHSMSKLGDSGIFSKQMGIMMNTKNGCRDGRLRHSRAIYPDNKIRTPPPPRRTQSNNRRIHLPPNRKTIRPSSATPGRSPPARFSLWALCSELTPILPSGGSIKVFCAGLPTAPSARRPLGKVASRHWAGSRSRPGLRRGHLRRPLHHLITPVLHDFSTRGGLGSPPDKLSNAG